MIIHISGTPAIGKTTLGKMLKRKYKKLVIFDTDDLLTAQDEKTIEKSTSMKNKKKTWNKITTDKLKKLFKKNEDKCLVIVGNLLGPDNTYYVLDDQYNGKNVYRILYDVPLKLAIKRYYEREISILNDENLLENVLSNDIVIPSTRRYVKMFENDNTWHTNNNYAKLTIKQIMSLLKSINKSEYPQHMDDTFYFISSKDNSVHHVWSSHVICNKLWNKNKIKVMEYDSKVLKALSLFLDYQNQFDHAVRELIKEKYDKYVKINKLKNKMNGLFRKYKCVKLH